MAGRFLRHRSEAARRQAEHDLAITERRVAKLVALATSLADRMDAMPSAGLERDLERRARVQALRHTAEAGTRKLAGRGAPPAADPGERHSA